MPGDRRPSVCAAGIRRLAVRLSVRAFALAWGIFWGLSLCFIPWWVMLFDGYTGETVLGRLYRGYTISPVGSLVGLAWGLVDGVISGALFAWIYNLVAGRLSREEGGRGGLREAKRAPQAAGTSS